MTQWPASRLSFARAAAYARGVRPRRLLAVVGAVAAVLLGTSLASGQMTKEQCVKANADGQALRNDGKLTDARALFVACGGASCPALVRTDCLQRLDELERAQPTIVFDVKDATGADASAVSVTVDGKPLASQLTGAALRVDPGDHRFTFAAPGQPPIVRRFVIEEGEKDRRERILLAPATPASVETTEGTPGDWSRQKTLGIISGSVGVAGIVVGSIFGIMTFSAAGQQKTDCPQAGCANHDQALSDHSTAVTDGTISTVAFIAGGALLAAGAFLFYTAPQAGSPRPAARLIVAPSVGPAAGGFSLRAEF
jgi:hypothetical protein